MVKTDAISNAIATAQKAVMKATPGRDFKVGSTVYKASPQVLKERDRIVRALQNLGKKAAVNAMKARPSA